MDIIAECADQFVDALDERIRKIVRDELSKRQTDIHVPSIKLKVDAEEFIRDLNKTIALIRGGEI